MRDTLCGRTYVLLYSTSRGPCDGYVFSYNPDLCHAFLDVEQLFYATFDHCLVVLAVFYSVCACPFPPPCCPLALAAQLLFSPSQHSIWCTKYLCPRERYEFLSAQHQDLAFAPFPAAMVNITEDNCHQVFAFSMLLVQYYFSTCLRDMPTSSLSSLFSRPGIWTCGIDFTHSRTRVKQGVLFLRQLGTL